MTNLSSLTTPVPLVTKKFPSRRYTQSSSLELFRTTAKRNTQWDACTAQEWDERNQTRHFKLHSPPTSPQLWWFEAQHNTFSEECSLRMPTYNVFISWQFRRDIPHAYNVIQETNLWNCFSATMSVPRAWVTITMTYCFNGRCTPESQKSCWNMSKASSTNIRFHRLIILIYNFMSGLKITASLYI